MSDRPLDLLTESSHLQISRDAIGNNLQRLKGLMKHSRLMAVLKNDGYGLTLVEYAALLIGLGVNALAVGTPEEAAAIRAEGFSGDLLLLTPQSCPGVLQSMLKRGVMLTVGNDNQAKAAADAAEAAGFPARVHVMVDTGLGRYGFSVEELEQAHSTLRPLCVTGAYTHFSAPYHKPYATHRQFHRYLRALRVLHAQGIKPSVLHCCASGAALRYPQMHLDMVRIGSALLGKVPSAGGYGLIEAVRYITPVIEIKSLMHRSGLGYNGRLRLRAGTRIALVIAGAACGFIARRRFHGLLPYRQYAQIRGNSVPILGELGINSLAIDLGCTDCREGDMVSLPVNPNLCVGGIKRKFIE